MIEKGAYVTVHATGEMLCLAPVLVSVRSIAVFKPKVLLPGLP